jgi:hypothetical protein
MSDSEWGTPPGAGGQLPEAGDFGPPGMSAEQIAYQRGRQDAIRQMTTVRMTPFRVVCGILWLAIAVGFGIGAIYNLANGTAGEGLVGLVIAALAGWYDYRIWTLKARRLFFII